jgi:hypothetical protein
MSATIQLRDGDMFAQPADLIIIPCSTAATITNRVAERLRSLEISPPRKRMNLGDVEFALFEGGSSISTYVGYAASVVEMRSDINAINKIAERVALFAKDKSEIRNITLPLLGSGAGSLTHEQSAAALIEGLERVKADNKVYNIFVYDRQVFERLKREIPSKRAIEFRPIGRQKHDHMENTSSGEPKTREAVRIFISYTKTSIEHQNWVRDLAKFLRENGIDARLDIWHLRPGMDVPQWMSNELDLADRILIICNEAYAARADGRLGGVGWEIRLVQGDLLQTQHTNPKKYVPIVRGKFKDHAMPKFLIGTYAITWSDQEENRNRRELLKELYDAYDQPPPLGSPPRYVLR